MCWQGSLTVESLSQTQKELKGFIIEWIFMCFIKIHKVKSSKYEWLLDVLAVIFDSWIFITNTKGTHRFYSWMNIHVLFQNSQGELFRIWVAFRCVGSDLWQLNLYHKHKRDTPHNATPYNAMPHNATPHNVTPHNATPHVFFCTLLDFSKLKLFFFHYR